MVISFQESCKNLLLVRQVKEGSPGVKFYSIGAGEQGHPIARLRSLYFSYSTDKEFFSFPSGLSLKAHISSHLTVFNKAKREQAELQASHELEGRLSLAERIYHQRSLDFKRAYKAYTDKLCEFAETYDSEVRSLQIE